MCLFGAELCAQQVSDVEVKQYAKQKYPELFLPKDEFESTAEYNQRLQQQKDFIKKVEKELKAELIEEKKEAERLKKEMIAEVERQLQIKISESLQSFEGKIFSLGKYDADSEEFTITMNLKSTFGFVFDIWTTEDIVSKGKGGEFYINLSSEVYSLPAVTGVDPKSIILGTVNAGEIIPYIEKIKGFYKIEYEPARST